MKIFNTLFCLAASCILLGFSTTVSVANTIVTGTITPLTYCPGDSVMVPFTSNGNFTGANVFTAQLSNDTGQFAPGVNIGTLTSTANSGTIHCMIPTNSFPHVRYRIRVIASSPVTTGSTSVDSFTVYSNAFAVNISAFGSTTICSGDSVAIWNVTGGHYTAYQWYRNNVLISGATADHYWATTGGIYTLRLSTPCATYTSGSGVVISVNQSPNMTIAGDTLICIGDNGLMQASGAYTYLWSPSSSLNQSNTALVSAHPTSTTTYTVTGTAINGCTSTLTHVLQVNPLPAVHIFSADDTICLGASVMLTATNCDLYFWSPSQYLNTSIGDTVYGTPPNTLWFVVIGKNISCAPISTDSVLVVVVPGTVVTVTGNDTICPGEQTTLTAAGANTYTWHPGNSLNDSTLTTVVASPTSTTLYHITGHLNGCNALDSFQVYVKPPPALVFTGADTICDGSTITLNVSGGVSYVWAPFVGMVDSSLTSQTVNPTSTTTYSVTALGSNGCYGSGTFTLTVIDCSGISEVTDDNAVSVFPNPASTNISVEFNVQGEAVTSITILDAKGSMVYNQAMAKGKMEKTSIDLSTMAKGIYILQITTEKGSYNKKVVLK